MYFLLFHVILIHSAATLGKLDLNKRKDGVFNENPLSLNRHKKQSIGNKDKSNNDVRRKRERERKSERVREREKGVVPSTKNVVYKRTSAAYKK